MKTAGTLSAVVGGGCLAFAAIMPTTVPTDSLLGGDSVHNIGLMQWQLMAWQLGLALLIIGAVLYVGGSLQVGGTAASPQAAPEPMTETETTHIDPHAKGDEAVFWAALGFVGILSAFFALVAWVQS
jgi:hypothetical protein